MKPIKTQPAAAAQATGATPLSGTMDRRAFLRRSGLVVGGTRSTRLLIRAIGPGLAAFGVPAILARPSIGVFRGTTSLRTNTGWSSEGFTQDLMVAAESVAAFPLAIGSFDCAMILTVDPGAYTIHLTGVGGTTGEALAEIYVLR